MGYVCFPRKHTLEVANLLFRPSWGGNRVTFKKPTGFGICQALDGAAMKRVQPEFQHCQLVRMSSG